MTPYPNGNHAAQVVTAERRKMNFDRVAGDVCLIYLLLTLGCLAWLMFDAWIGRYFILKQLGYANQREQTLRLIVFTVSAGALGGVVNGLRSALKYRGDFHRLFMWKYLCAPWMGATLALIVFALLLSGMSALGGSPTVDLGSAQVLANFSIGALVGYGSKDVFNWLDGKVEDFFKSDRVGKGSKKSTECEPEAMPAAPPRKPLGQGDPLPLNIETNGRAN